MLCVCKDLLAQNKRSHFAQLKLTFRLYLNDSAETLKTVKLQKHKSLLSRTSCYRTFQNHVRATAVRC